jgi:D-tyrosyl-tRNA(Tyr) deacylase
MRGENWITEGRGLVNVIRTILFPTAVPAGVFRIGARSRLLESEGQEGATMRAVVQRVSSASVRVEGRELGSIGPGAVVLLGVGARDTEEEARWMARKIVELRIFADAEGTMNRSLMEIGGALLVVSQFTLYGDCRKGRRPSYTDAAPPELAEPLYRRFVDLCRDLGAPVATGSFGAMMDVEIRNQGPVTLLLERTSDERT